MPYPIKNLIEGREFPVCVGPTDPVQKALDLMIEHDFNQLPVIETGNVPVGMVTHESILRALRNFRVKIEHLRVSSAIVKAGRYRLDDDLFDLLDRLRDTYAVLIVDNQDKLVGIVTTYDSTEYFRRRAEDIMLVEDIETMVKDLILAAFSNSDGEPDKAKLDAAIDEIMSSGSALKRPYSKALREYLKLAGDEAPDIKAAWLEQSFTHLAPKEETKSFEELTLYEYTQLLLHPRRWGFYKNTLELESAAIRQLLDDVRTTRNILAHFRGEVSPVRRDQLRFCRDWLTAHQMGIPVSWPVTEPALRVGQTTAQAAISEPKAVNEVASDVREAEIMPVEDEPFPGESRYAPLAIFLQSRPPADDRIDLSFEQIEQILGDALPASAYSHRAWWANDSAGHVQSRQWLDVGWRVGSINMTSQLVRFMRIKERERSYIDFYKALYDRLQERAEFKLHSKALPGASWLTVSSLPSDGKAVASLGFSFARFGRFRVELYIDTGEQKANKEIFDFLLGRQSQIDQIVKERLTWERLDHRRASRIALYQQGSITDGPEELSKLREQAVEAMVNLEKAVREPVEQARAVAFPGL